jgi:DMSO reductase family type II enzyme chaperone
MTVRAPSSELDVAHARCAAYALISYGFQYPDRELVRALADPARWTSWVDVIQRVAPDTVEHLAAVRAALQVGSGKAAGEPDVEPAERQETFNRLFGHAVRGKCPPYELEYGRSEIIQQAFFLADIAGFYTAFGMEVGRDTDERADHLTIESEFMSVLCAKEAYAIEEGNPDHLDIAVKAQRNFLKDHLARWLPAFAHRVQQADPQGFYGALAGFASAFVSAECRRFEIAAGPHTAELRPADPVLDTSISCGSLPDGPAGTGDGLVQLTVDSGRDQDR